MRHILYDMFLAVLLTMPNLCEAEWVTTTVTAYSPQECDSAYTASGTMPRDGVVACNWLPFGSRVQIDGTWYTVEDRGGMDGIDIFMDSHQDAIDFGTRTESVYIDR